MYNLRKEIFGANHSDTIRAGRDLVHSLNAFDTEDDSLKYVQEVYYASRKHYGEDHPVLH